MEGEEEAEKGAVVGHAPVSRAKRLLRNKALSISFNDKDLKDYVGGFHKRKKKRRKEAEKQQEEAERRKRLEDRKRRRKEKEYALYGGAPPEKDAEPNNEDLEEDESRLNPSVSGTTTYENGDVVVTVTTSELTHAEEEHPTKKPAPLSPVSVEGATKKHNIPVSKKKPMKKAKKGSSRPKLLNKRDRRKGKSSKKRH